MLRRSELKIDLSVKNKDKKLCKKQKKLLVQIRKLLLFLVNPKGVKIVLVAWI